MKRGEIYYIERANTFGSEQMAGRPAVVVSNDKCNFNSEVVEIVYLTTAPKVELPTHVTIRSTGKPSTALCEQITSVSVTRIGGYAGECTDVEMAAIDQALAISLDINRTLPTQRVNTIIRKEPEVSNEPDPLVQKLESELVRRTFERDMYKEMYDKLIDKLTN